MSSNNDLVLPPQTMNALYKQELHLKNNPIPGINFIYNENDITDIQAEIEGPVATPYEGGLFRVTIKLLPNFPVVAPKGIFLTKIFHPNISEQGEICVNTLKRDWNQKNWSLSNLFQVIKCLLIIPFPQSALNEEAGKLFMEDYDQFFKIAKMFTQIHAKSNKNKMIIEEKEEKNDFSDDEEDNKIKNDIYSTPVKKKKRRRDFYETDSTEKKKTLSFNEFDFSSGNKSGKNMSEIKNINNINFNNNCKLDMYSLCSIKKNISVSDSKNKKEEIDKWIKRI